MLCFSKPFSTVCTRDFTRPTVVISGVALFLAVAIAGVGEANTTARSLTVEAIDSARRTRDFTVRGLWPIGTAQECCPFGLRAFVLPDFVGSLSLPYFPLPLPCIDPSRWPFWVSPFPSPSESLSSRYRVDSSF